MCLDRFLQGTRHTLIQRDMNQHYKKLKVSHKRYLIYFLKETSSQKHNQYMMMIQQPSIYQQRMFQCKKHFAIHLLHQKFLLDNLCKMMLQLENTFQGHKLNIESLMYFLK